MEDPIKAIKISPNKKIQRISKSKKILRRNVGKEEYKTIKNSYVNAQIYSKIYVYREIHRLLVIRV